MKVAFLTLGCKVNYYETEKIMNDFKKLGATVVDFSDKADVYLINTCTVTNIADRKSRQMISKARKNGPDSIIVATGCYIDGIKDNLPENSGIDYFFANNEKKVIAEKIVSIYESKNEDSDEIIVEEAYKNVGDKLQEDNSADIPHEKSDQGENHHNKSDKTHKTEGRTRKYIKIQDGCNQFCTYCMIPYVRGKGVLKSTPEEEVLEEVRNLADNGTKEVVLTGIHLSSYGVDRYEDKNFVDLKGMPLISLMKKIAEVPGIERIRLSSLEPRIICNEFLEELVTIKEVCPHFHLSLQSGCDEVLKRMNRHYTTEEYFEKCELIRKYYEHPAITTDIIAGFPGETEENFATTVEFAKNVGFADIHVFPYSVRKGTMASKMDGMVDSVIKKQRANALIEEAKILKEKYDEYFNDKKVKVLFEEVVQQDGTEYMVGHNERYVMFKVPVEKAREMGYKVNEIAEI